MLGRLIRWGETDPGETPAWTNHAGVVVETGWLVPPYIDVLEAGGTVSFVGEDGVSPDPGPKMAVVVEALWHTRKGPLKLNGVEVRVFRPVPPYTPEEKAAFVANAEIYIGDRYGWWKLLFQLGDRAFFKGRKVLSDLAFINKDRPICSYVAAMVNNAARPLGSHIPGCEYWPLFGMLPPEAADPDTMLDFCEKRPDFWQEVK